MIHMQMTLGQHLQLTLFGTSHGPLVGAYLQGVPNGIPIDRNEINKAMDKRKPGAKGWRTSALNFSIKKSMFHYNVFETTHGVETFRNYYQGPPALLGSEFAVENLSKECIYSTKDGEWSSRSLKWTGEGKPGGWMTNRKKHNGQVSKSGRVFIDIYCTEKQKQFRLEQYEKQASEEWPHHVMSDQVYGKDKEIAPVRESPNFLG